MLLAAELSEHFHGTTYYIAKNKYNHIFTIALITCYSKCVFLVLSPIPERAFQ
jgi:hypothetical protein